MVWALWLAASQHGFFWGEMVGQELASLGVSKLYKIYWPDIAPMKIIRDIPLGEPDGDLLGISLPDPLEKLRHAGSKLNCLGGGRLV